MVRPLPVVRSRTRLRAGAVLIAVSLAATACSDPQLVDGSGDLLVNRGVPSQSAAPSSRPVSGSASASAVPRAARPTVSPALRLLQQLRAVSTRPWRAITDARTGTGFSLPSVVPARTQLQNGISQRLYQHTVTEQSTISVGYVRAPSAAAAQALLGQYPEQLQASVRALGADDGRVSERQTSTVDGKPSLSFRFAFTPTTVPQIPPVWLASATADGADIVLAQTIVFPPSPEYDYLDLARTAQRRLVASLRLPG